MGQVLHGSATTTEAVRRAIQHSQESLRGLAKRYGVNPKTVAKWRSADLRFRSADRAEGAQIDSPVSRGRGRRRCIPKAYFAAARRLPVRSAAHHPASDRARPFTGVCNATGSPGCRRSKAKPRPSANSRPIRSAIFISTSPKFEPRKANSTCSSRSTERRSSPSSSCTRRWRAAPRGTSCAA